MPSLAQPRPVLPRQLGGCLRASRLIVVIGMCEWFVDRVEMCYSGHGGLGRTLNGRPARTERWTALGAVETSRWCSFRAEQTSGESSSGNNQDNNNHSGQKQLAAANVAVGYLIFTCRSDPLRRRRRIRLCCVELHRKKGKCSCIVRQGALSPSLKVPDQNPCHGAHRRSWSHPGRQ